ncbi:MAG: hypothetical protein ACI9IV_000830 [Paracoccaceae bacterium]|jgi:hypothetical protein
MGTSARDICTVGKPHRRSKSATLTTLKNDHWQWAVWLYPSGGTDRDQVILCQSPIIDQENHIAIDIWAAPALLDCRRVMRPPCGGLIMGPEQLSIAPHLSLGGVRGRELTHAFARNHIWLAALLLKSCQTNATRLQSCTHSLTNNDPAWHMG